MTVRLAWPFLLFPSAFFLEPEFIEVLIIDLSSTRSSCPQWGLVGRDISSCIKLRLLVTIRFYSLQSVNVFFPELGARFGPSLGLQLVYL